MMSRAKAVVRKYLRAGCLVSAALDDFRSVSLGRTSRVRASNCGQGEGGENDANRGAAHRTSAGGRSFSLLGESNLNRRAVLRSRHIATVPGF